jgi:hypothetical protein
MVTVAAHSKECGKYRPSPCAPDTAYCVTAGLFASRKPKLLNVLQLLVLFPERREHQVLRTRARESVCPFLQR